MTAFLIIPGWMTLGLLRIRRRIAWWVRLGATLALSMVACAASEADGTVQIAARGQPELIFACDRPTDQLRGLFTPAVIGQLRTLHAGIALSTEDFSAERGRIVQELMAAGIPMSVWIVLRREDGYYVNSANVAQTSARLEEFMRWSRDYRLRWVFVGLDIEPRLTEFAKFKEHKFVFIGDLIRRAWNLDSVLTARSAYAALIRRMQASGFRMQTHQLPFIADERAAHTTALERLLGIVDVRGDDEVLMLYSSMNHDAGAGMICAYGPAAQTIAVGTTTASGDPATDARMPPLTWPEFVRDLVVAAHFSSIVGVYSLEGCVRQGYLSRLSSLDWNAPVSVPTASIARASEFRRNVHRVLWVAAHLPYFGAGCLVLVAALFLGFRHWRRRRRSDGLTAREEGGIVN